MIKIVAKMVIKEECIEEFHALAQELVEKSRAEEGNISYSLNQSMSDPKYHAMIEIWKDQAAIDFHNNTAHFTGIVPKFAPLAEKMSRVEIYKEIEW